MMMEKGVFVVLEACRILQETDPLFECHFVGAWSDISEEGFNAKVRELDLGQKVVAHGAQYGTAKIEFFKNTDVFVFPTFYHNEAFPLVNIEAMQQGIPIISTPEGGIRDMVIEGKTGFLVEQRNAVELAQKMAVMIQDPELRETMGANAREHYETRFTLAIFEENMKRILNSAARKDKSLYDLGTTE